MKVTVFRGAGDKQGPDVVDPLLMTELAGIARGRREIDYHSSNRTVESGVCPLMPYLAPGSLVNVTKARSTYRGKLQSWALTIDIDDGEFTISNSINIERET